MANYLDKNGLKKALSGFWTGAKSYIDEVSRVAAAAATELQNKINLKQDILGFWGTYDKDTNKVATESEVKSHVSGITGALSSLLTTAKGSLVAAINEVKGSVDTLSSDSKVSIEVADTAETGFLKTYEFYQGENTSKTLIGKVNIPKDLVVTSGSNVRGTWSGDTFTESAEGADHAIKLIIANQDAPVYINVKDLFNDYTTEQGAAKVQLTIDENHQIKATIVAKSIEKGDLSEAVQASLDLADTALQEHQSLAEYRKAADQDTIDNGKVDKTQTIAGVDLQDNITKAEMLTALNVADGATADSALSNEEIDAVIAEIFPAA